MTATIERDEFRVKHRWCRITVVVEFDYERPGYGVLGWANPERFEVVAGEWMDDEPATMTPAELYAAELAYCREYDRSPKEQNRVIDLCYEAAR